MKKTGSLTLRWLLVLIVLLGLTHGMTLTALADGDADETVTLAENASLDGANTSRNLAVGRDGVIHIVYRSGDSIFYRKSTNSGSTYSEPVTVATGNECEVAVSSTGRVFVAYVNNSNLYIAYSDNGTRFTSVPLEANSYSLHIAVDGSHVYAIPREGTVFFYSSNGGQSYESHTGWAGYAYSDVHIDESNHNVVILKDDPNVVCRYSSDYGETFSDESPVKCGEEQIQVYFSTAAVGKGYAYMAGNNAGFNSSTDYLYKIDYINATATGTLISACDSNAQNGRSLSADHNGNVVVGYVSNGKACYQVSLNGGETVGSGVEFADASAANAAINTKTGDVLFLYESDGKIMLHKAAGVVPGDSIVYNGEWQYLLDSRFEPVCQEEGARYVLGTNDQTAPSKGWGEDIPRGKDAGFYYVWVQSNTTESTCKIVEIVKANALKTKPEGVAAINYNGEAQALAVAGEAASGKIVYALGESDTEPAETAYSETIPTAAEKGDYTVWYKVVEFDAQNYYADEPQSVKSNIDIYHTLTYAPGDGTGEPYTVMVKNGTSTTIPKNTFTAPDEKFFTGWSDGSAVYPVGASYTPTGNATLTAQWTLGTTISYELTDSCGDGWNGAAIKVTDKETGNVIATLTVESGYGASGTLDIPAGRTVVFTWVSGRYDNECSYTVKDAEDNVIFSGGDAMSEPKEYRYGTAIPTYTVTYKVVNGTWSDNSTADKTENVQSGSQPAGVPTGMKAASGYTGGAWDTDPAGATITGATTFTYTFTAKTPVSQTVTFKVVNGSWNEGEGEAATADKTVTLTGYEGDTLKLAANQIPAVGSKPNDTYKAGSWNVTPSAETEITEATTYTYTYAQKDAISQTVTFKVVNGSWNDETTTDKTVTLTGYEGDTLKLAANQIPAVGSKPNDTYKAGSWNVTPSAETEITEATTYTYTYVAKEAAVVTKAPEAKTLTYTGQEQALVTAGEATGGTLQYALGSATEATGTYSTTIPTAIDAGTYYVWYKVVGDANHTDFAGGPIEVTIEQRGNDTAEGEAKFIPNDADTDIEGLDTSAQSSLTDQLENVADADTTQTSEDKVKDVKVTLEAKAVATNEQNPEQGAILSLVSEGLSGEEEPTTDFLELTVTKTVTVYKTEGEGQTVENSTTTKLTKLDQVIDIPVKYNMTGKYNLAVSRNHEGTVTVFTRLSAMPEAPYTDGTFYVEGSEENTIVHIFSSKYSTYAFTTYGDRENARIEEKPTGKTLTYNGSEQELVEAGSATGGEMQYAPGKDATTVPTDGWTNDPTTIKATNVGTYYVWYKVIGDATHNDSEAKCIQVTINRKSTPSSSYTPTYNVTFIVVNGSWDDGDRENKTFSSITSLSPSQIPAVGNKPDEGYMAGSWNKTPSTSISKNTTYIYTYAEKPLPTVTKAPEGKDLTETGDEQELITPGTAIGGTMQYVLGSSTGTYSSIIPKATEAGTYYVWYKVLGDEEHRSTDPTSIEITIKENIKPEATVTKAPERKDLTDIGEEQALITAGEASGGTMEYALSITKPTSWSSSIPTATKAGTYYVWYRVKGDTDHSNSTPERIVVTVKYGANTLVNNGEEQNLVIPGSAEGGTMVYLLGTDDVTPPEGTWSDTIPTGKDVGPYYVWYKVIGDENHNDSEPLCIKVTIVPDSEVKLFEELLDTLPEEVTRDDEELVEALRTLYDDLDADQKKQIPEEDVKKLEMAEARIKELQEIDQAMADAVSALIDQLPEVDEVKPENKTAVDAVQKQYDALTDDQKAMIPKEKREKLEGLIKALAGPSAEDQAISERFTAAVNAVPGNKAGEGKGLVDEATAIYLTMTDAQKAIVKQETYDLYDEELAAFKEGRKFRSGDGYYRVLSNGDVTYHHHANKDITGVLVPNQVKKGKFFFKVIRVSDIAFRDYNQLRWVIISKNVYVLGEKVFSRTPNLRKVRVLGTGFKSGKVTDAFVRDGKLTVKVPGSKLNEYRELFTGEGGLDGVIIAA